MNRPRLSGPVAFVLVSTGLSSCSQPLAADGRLFARWADAVAAVPLDDGPPAPAARSAGPAAPAAVAAGPMKIDLIDRTTLVDSKTAGLRAAVAVVDSQMAGLRRQLLPDAPAPVRASSVTRAATPPSAAARSESAGAGQAFVAQLAAFPTRAAAEAGLARLKAAHSQAVTILGLRFREVDLGAKGVWTRLQTRPFASREQAAAVCARIGVPAQGCVVPAGAGARA